MNREKTIYNRIIKRILDVICSFMAIVFLSIVYLPICVVIKCTSKGPIFFKQKRIGKDKKYFNGYNEKARENCFINFLLNIDDSSDLLEHRTSIEITEKAYEAMSRKKV